MKLLDNAAVARELVRAYLTYCLSPAYGHVEREELHLLVLNMWSLWLGRPLVEIPVTRSHLAAEISAGDAPKRVPRKRTPRRSASVAASGDGDPVTPKASGTGQEPEQAARA